jgi:transcription factor E
MASKKNSEKTAKKTSDQKKQIRFLKQIVEDLINKDSSAIIDLLAGKRHVNEFTIAKRLELTINQTRNILYKLSDYGLVSSIRKKDKKKGWFIYSWTINPYQALSLLEENMKKKLEILNSQLKKRKNENYYFCETCSIEVSEEKALLEDFTCEECYEVYELSNNQEIILDLEKKIEKIKKDKEQVTFEKGLEGKKIEKKKARKIKKAEDEKKAKRAAKRAERKAEKEAELKKLGKKITKKPVKKSAKKSIKKTSKKPVKKASKKPVKKSAKKKTKK